MDKAWGNYHWRAVVLGVLAFAAVCGAEEKFTGKVVDVEGHSVAGAEVRLCGLKYGSAGYEMAAEHLLKSGEDGGFVFKLEESLPQEVFWVITAEKEGLAVGWSNRYSQAASEPLEITLRPAGRLDGVVVDGAGEPIAGAEVRVLLAADKSSRPRYLFNARAGYLSVSTDAEGRFAFGELPDDTGVVLQVSKAGKGTVVTYNPEAGGSNMFLYSVGQAGIKIELGDECVIEGKVVDASGEPVGGIEVGVGGRRVQFMGRERFVAAADGSFRLDGLSAGSYKLTAVFEQGKGAAPWITKGADVEVSSGEHKKDVQIVLEEGGLLEITVTESGSGAVVENAHVSIERKEPREYMGLPSDKEGKARARLLPGAYQVRGVSKPGMTGRDEQEFVIESGKTVRLSISIEGLPKVRGQVLDLEGNALAGAEVVVKPAGHRGVKTEADGRYEAIWDSTHWSGDTTYCLVARHEEKDLAFSQVLETGTESVTVKMEKGWVISGTASDGEGNPINGAGITLMLRVGNWGSSLGDGERPQTEGEGRFRIGALPPERDYNVYVSADGYGKRQISVKADQFEEGRHDMGVIALPTANLSISGMVVDLEGNPVKGATIYGYGGDGQPDVRDITTDAEGKFVIKGVCEGRLRLSAQHRGDTNMYGSVQTEGGAEDVTIVIGERSSSGGFVPRQPASLKGKALPSVEDLGPVEAEVEGKKIAICFWDVNQRPSRYFVKELAARSEALKGRFAVVLVDSSGSKDAVGAWMKENGVSYAHLVLGEEAGDVHFKWGVKGLPWLIVADDGHVVRWEGVSAGQIDEALGIE